MVDEPVVDEPTEDESTTVKQRERIQRLYQRKKQQKLLQNGKGKNKMIKKKWNLLVEYTKFS